MTATDWFTERYAKEVAAGLHDEKCERLPSQGFHLCDCRKRERLARGLVELPDDLIYQCPMCPECYREVHHNGDSFECIHCHVQWNDNLSGAAWTDDYGDLAADRARWLERLKK